MSAKLTPQRLAAFRALWRALRSGRQPGAPGLGERARALPRLVRAVLTGQYRELSVARIALFLLGLVYLVSPIDVVPELALTLFGLGDDAVVAMLLAGTFLTETERFLAWERQPPKVVEGQLG